MTKKEQIAAFLDDNIKFERVPVPNGLWGTTSPWAQNYYYPPFFGSRPTEEQLAREWLGLAEFRALQLGTWLGTTDGRVIAEAVESVTPPFYRQDLELLVAALQQAAVLQQQEGQQAAGRFALRAIGLAAVFAVAIAVSSRAT